MHLLLLLVLSPPGICFPHQQLFKKRRCKCYHVHTPDTHSSCCVSYWKKFMGILLLEWISWHALIWPNSDVMKTEKKGYVTGWNLFVDQLCVCLSGPWERARSLIMKCTRTCTKVCALSLRQPKRTEKPKWGKKWGRQGNWHVMWGNSYPIIPNNSLSQDTSSALILRNPPQLIPNRLAPILSFISCIFLLLTSRLFCPLQIFF